jgi:hypothetical protein
MISSLTVTENAFRHCRIAPPGNHAARLALFLPLFFTRILVSRTEREKEREKEKERERERGREKDRERFKEQRQQSSNTIFGNHTYIYLVPLPSSLSCLPSYTSLSSQFCTLCNNVFHSGLHDNDRVSRPPPGPEERELSLGRLEGGREGGRFARAVVRKDRVTR